LPFAKSRFGFLCQEAEQSTQTEICGFNRGRRRSRNPSRTCSQAQQKEESKRKHATNPIKCRSPKRIYRESHTLEGNKRNPTVQSATTHFCGTEPTLWHIPSHTESHSTPTTYPHLLPAVATPHTSSSSFDPQHLFGATSLAISQLTLPEHTNAKPRSTHQSSTPTTALSLSKSSQGKDANQTPFQTSTGKRKSKGTKTLKSRRAAKQRILRQKKKLEAKSNMPLQQKHYHTLQRCLKNYGFCANPNYTLQKNFNDNLKANSSENENLPQPINNLSFHNFCKINTIPTGTRQLLGLNLRYCLASSQLHNNIRSTVQKMAYTIRTKYHLQRLGQATDSTYIKQIYIKNKHWNPEPAPTLVKDTITIFDKSLHKMQDALNTKQQKMNLRNLTTLQSQTLRTLKKSTHLTIKPTDKNLGPAILDTDNDIQQVLKEHLLTSDYRQLNNDTAKLQMANIINSIHELSKAEQLYFHRSFQHYHRTPIFMDFQRCIKSQLPSDQL